MTKAARDALDGQISGLQKASILMLALGEEHAGRLFAMMHEDEIKAISATMAQLGVIHADTVEALCGDFVDNFGATGGIMGSYESTENLLLRALPKDRVSQIMEEIRGPAGRTMWDKLGNVSEEILASYLKNEYPQTVAVVLSMIKADHSARVLTLLPDAFAMEVVMRMLRMESIQKDVLERVERILRAEFMSNLARASRQDAHQMIAEIFNNFDRKAETRFLTGLEERNRESAEKVKSQMFTFNDLQRLSPPGLQVLLRQIDKDKLPIALKGTTEAIRGLFLSQLSERAAKMLRDDIAALGPVKMKDVEDVQAGIANLAKELAAQGEIDISTGSDDRMIE
ncbi:MAG: flagellar motor switch protein FliG [Rhodopila sp.]|nr:flagellar motor switch protein FliG [Rhodopila sp.]